MDPLRMAVFIDGANLEYSRRGIDIHRINLEKMIEQILEIASEGLRKPLTLTFKGWFSAIHEDANRPTQAFLEFLRINDYEVVTTPIRPYFDWGKETEISRGDLDATIGFAISDHQNEYDVIVLVSGDGDFTWIVSELKNRGKTVIIVSIEEMVSRDLREQADIYIDLTDLEIDLGAN